MGIPCKPLAHGGNPMPIKFIFFITSSNIFN